MTKAIKSSDIRKQNRYRIYHLLKGCAHLSKQDIVQRLNLSLPTVTNNINQLEKNGLIYADKFKYETGGRNARLYQINPNYRVSIGISITKNHISALILNIPGEVIARNKVLYPFSRTDKYYKNLGNIIENLVHSSGIDPNLITQVGISLPGLVTIKGDETYYCRILDIDHATVDEFAKYIPYHCKLFHDSNVAAFAERKMNTSTKHFFYMMIGSSFGGAFIHNHEAYEGDHNRSAEVGHLKLVPNGKLCYCGKQGCAEMYCNERALLDGTEYDLETFFNALTEKNNTADKIFREYSCYLASSIHAVHMFFDCEIVLGGSIGSRLAPHLDLITKKVALLDPFSDRCDYVSICRCKDEACARGAAQMLIDDFVERI